MDMTEVNPADLCDQMDVWHAASNSSLVKFFALVSVYDRDHLWKVDGATSMAAWLTFRFGLSPGTAREWVTAARALPELPAVQREFAEGRLSFDQVKFVCRLATPDTDERWAGEAVKYTVGQLEVMARRRREISSIESEAIHRQRFHRMRWDPEHRVLRYRGMLPEEQGAILESAINRLVDRGGEGSGFRSLSRLRCQRRRRHGSVGFAEPGCRIRSRSGHRGGPRPGRRSHLGCGRRRDRVGTGFIGRNGPSVVV